MRHQRRTLKKILDWANGIDSTTEYSEMYHTILVHLDDERPGRLQHIAKLEQEMASFSVCLPGFSSPAHVWHPLPSPGLFLTVYSSIFLQNRGLRNHRGGVAPGAVSPPGADGSTC